MHLVSKVSEARVVVSSLTVKPELEDSKEQKLDDGERHHKCHCPETQEGVVTLEAKVKHLTVYLLSLLLSQVMVKWEH